MFALLSRAHKHAAPPPPRGLPVLIEPPFRDESWVDWVLETNAIDGIAELEIGRARRRVHCLAWEYADSVGCRQRVAPQIDDGTFDGAAFSRWMRDRGVTSHVVPARMHDMLAWYCLVIAPCSIPKMTLGCLLFPHGWERHRGAPRIRGDRVSKPHLYRLKAP